jgi:hypothetical protein
MISHDWTPRRDNCSNSPPEAGSLQHGSVIQSLENSEKSVRLRVAAFTLAMPAAWVLHATLWEK